jgi:DNA-binding MarR family transcriptional regulator/N-acetylglutamate synthase-like GNAT family acetyltransferase
MSAQVAAVRRFNRFYTNVIGVLREGMARTPHSLTEARVLFELGQRDEAEVADLRRTLEIDAGYLSRLLARFAADGLVERQPSPRDARRHVIRLTATGRATFRHLDERTQEEVAALLEPLAEEDRRRLVAAMETIHSVLSDRPRPAGYVIRAARPGDLGWVVQRHGVVYGQEHGWDTSFEALVARIVADYVDNHDPKRENLWIADVDGEPVGCVFCVRRDDETAQLRLLFVEPSARGVGIGGRLVDECVRFARQAGYRRMMLWTQNVLTDARRIYERAGFELRESEPHHSFGADLVGQNLWRDL